MWASFSRLYYLLIAASTMESTTIKQNAAKAICRSLVRRLPCISAVLFSLLFFDFLLAIFTH